MAKLYKIELYVADYNDVYDNVDDLVHCLNSGWGLDDVIMDCFDIQEVAVEWNDGIDLNYEGNDKTVYDKYFGK